MIQTAKGLRPGGRFVRITGDAGTTAVALLAARRDAVLALAAGGGAPNDGTAGDADREAATIDLTGGR